MLGVPDITGISLFLSHLDIKSFWMGTRMNDGSAANSGDRSVAGSEPASSSGGNKPDTPKMDFKSRVREWVDADEEAPGSLYAALKPWARFLKTAGQMLIGLGTAVAVFAALIMRSGALVHHPGVLSHDVHGAGTLTDEIFAITAIGLGAAAALELAYTLFTPGPDEAINPLMLGVSSTFLFLASKTEQLTWQFGFSAVLVVIALSGLFGLQTIFKRLYPDNHRKPDSNAETAPPPKDDPGADQAAEPSADRLV